MKRIHALLTAVVVYGYLSLPFNAQAQNPAPSTFTIRPGYRIDLIAQNIGEVRFIEFGLDGSLYVSQPRTGSIITLREHDGIWSKVADFTTGKPTVHGMHFYDGWLWFTQSGAIWKARDTNGDGKADEEVKVVDNLPSAGTHWWRSILVTPTGLYTSIGDSGNITDEMATDRQKIWKFNLDGTGKTLFASGLRNTEKLRLRPGTDEVWGADHGSDGYGHLLGETQGVQPFTDHLPAEKFNHYREGGFYGHPFIVGNGLPRLEFKDRPDFIELASKAILPAWAMPAHWAPNGWNFAQSDALGLRGDAIIACHGSWNSTVKVGYRVERIMFDPMTQQPMGSEVLVSMLTENKEVLGRPCDIAEGPDGSLYISDDSRGRIYRLSRQSSSTANLPPDVLPLAPAPPSGSVAFTPLDYFQTSCAKCHGEYGLMYGPAFKGKLSDDLLRQKVQLMSTGPAQAPISHEKQEAIVDFLRSLRDSHPYGTVLTSGNDGAFGGEALPGSKLRVESGGKSADVTLTGHSWHWHASEDMPATGAVLHVQKDGAEITLPLKP